MSESKGLGSAGEDFAADWFENRGYRIIARNWRAKSGEIDIILQKDTCIIFVEVKTFAHTPFEALTVAVDKRKQERICKTAKYFLLNNRKYNGMDMRFDVLVVPFDPRIIAADPIHLENAFEDYV